MSSCCTVRRPQGTGKAALRAANVRFGSNADISGQTETQLERHSVNDVEHPRAAPGQLEALLRWMAEQDRASVAAGVAPSQVYVHTDGDSWDYMVINPVTTDAQDAATEAAAKKMGVAYGPRASLEFRKFIMTHTDTFVRGPMTPAQILAN